MFISWFMYNMVQTSGLRPVIDVGHLSGVIEAMHPFNLEKDTPCTEGIFGYITHTYTQK